jgi:nucleotide-binding universal stress UspA family protein
MMPKDFIAREARSVDIVIASQCTDPRDSFMGAEPADLIMETGRPVLIVPRGQRALDLEHVLIGWTDTRETRRAVQDALPLLRKAKIVTVAEICEAKNAPEASGRVNDVTKWLSRHGVPAFATTIEGHESEVDLDLVATNFGAGLVVAGAYGHSRLREWILGGVTKKMLTGAARCFFTSR